LSCPYTYVCQENRRGGIFPHFLTSKNGGGAWCGIEIISKDRDKDVVAVVRGKVWVEAKERKARAWANVVLLLVLCVFALNAEPRPPTRLECLVWILNVRLAGRQ
jgi:hypothetical protein